MQPDCIWWDHQLPPDERARKALDAAKTLVKRHAADQTWHTQACIAFYDASVRPGSILSRWRSHDGASQYNVIQSVVDTFTSHVIRNRVRLLFLTEAGNRKERIRAQGMTQACEAAFDEAGLYGEEGTQICRDGCRDGTGVVKVTPDYENSRILIERCLREELFVDERDARLGHPRQLMHRHRVDKAVLMARYPQHADAIREAKATEPEDITEHLSLITNDQSVAEQLAVYEMWHLPSGRTDATTRTAWGLPEKESDEKKRGRPKKIDPGHDGRHVIVLEGGSSGSDQIVLLDEPYPIAQFPFAFFRVKPRAVGFDGRGFVETLRHVQVQINRMLRRVDGMMQLHGKLTLYVNRAANINPARLTNDWSQILEGDGPAQQAITHIAPASVPGDYINQIDKLIAWSFQMVGLSELSVHAERPKSMQSGAAVRTLLDTESIRHTDVFRAWEDFHRQLGRVVVNTFRLMAWKDPNFEVMWGDSKDLKRIKWKEVDLDDTRWKLTIWPTNLLPSTPSAKLEKVLEMYREQALSREEMMTLLDYPDLKAVTGEEAAGLANVERCLQRLEDGEGSYEESMPHAYMPLGMAHKLALRRYNSLEAEGADADTLERILTFLEDVQALMADAKPQPQPSGAAPEPAAAAPPPTTPGAAPLTTGGKVATQAPSQQVAAPEA